MAKRFFVKPDGSKVSLFEAPYKYGVRVYKSDCKKAAIGNPEQCLIALGAKRDKNVEAAFIGSGKDAYLVFRGKPNAPSPQMRVAHALHFTIRAMAARVRDFFDTHRGAVTLDIELSAPTPGRTLAHRAKLNKARMERIKAGTHEVKKRDKAAATRIMRLGVPHRPKAAIEKNVVSIHPKADAAT